MTSRILAPLEATPRHNPAMELRRVLSAREAAWLVAGNMFGAGIFFTPGFVAATLPGLAGPLAAWTFGGVLALAGAAVYAELGARLPHAGGDYQYLTRAFGPLWGFLTGWAAWTLSFSAAAAAMAQVVVSHFAAAVTGGAAVTPLTERVGAAAIVLLLTAANVAGARVAGRTTALLTSLPIAVLLGVFAWGLLAGSARPRWPEAWVAAPGGAWPIAFGAAMVPVFFTYSGWNVAAYLAGELERPSHALPRALLAGTAAVTVLYLAANVALLGLLGDALATSGSPGADAVGLLLGGRAERLVAAVIGTAIVGSANVTLMAGARIYYAMARDGLAPRGLVRTNARGVPSAALWAGGSWAALLAVAAPVRTLYSWATLAILLLSSIAVAALFVLRRRGVGDTAYRCPGYPLTPWLYLLASVGVAAASAVREPLESLAGVAIVLAGIPAYAAWTRLR